MRRSHGPFAFLVAICAVAFSAHADSSVGVNLSPTLNDLFVDVRVPIDAEVRWRVYYYWGGDEVPAAPALVLDLPGELVSVESDDGVECMSGQPIRCTVPASAVEHSGALFVTMKVNRSGHFTPTATISSTTPDPYGEDNVHTVPLDVLDVPAIRFLRLISLRPPPPLEPGTPVEMDVAVLNEGAPAKDVMLRLTLPEGGTFTQASDSCTVTSAEVVCTNPAAMTYFQIYQVRVGFTTPERLEGGPITLRAVQTSPQPDFDPDPTAHSAEFHRVLIRHFLVTNTNDEGAGSLRQAILDAYDPCVETQPCTIEFRLTPEARSDGGWFSIHPNTPLPEVRGNLKLDGATQTAFGGDTNPDGPEIELNGSLLTSGAGLLLGAGCEMQILDLAVNGFPDPGIESRRADLATLTCVRRHDNTITYIARNYVGTDPRGRTAMPNYRGIVLAGTRFSILENNLISGNLRAGIFVDGGSYTSIVRNRVGISSEGLPLGNSCGIFLHIGNRSYGFYGLNGADAIENVVAFNTDFGIARSAEGSVSMQRNSIYGQLYGAIDTGLDLQTPNVADDSFTAPNKPVLFDAFYDAASDRTVVRGRVDSGTTNMYFANFEIDVYASRSLSRSGLPQSERWLTSSFLDSGTAGQGDFTIELPGDLRGRYITATNTRSHYVGFAKPPDLSSEGHTRGSVADTSELSDALIVH